MSEDSIEFSLSNSEQRDSWLNSGHRTLDADTFCHRTFSELFLHSSYCTFCGITTCAERVQKRIAHWDKQNNDVPAPNCVLKVQGKIIKI